MKAPSLMVFSCTVRACYLVLDHPTLHGKTFVRTLDVSFRRETLTVLHCYVAGFAMVPGGRREENDRRRRPSKASGYALDDAKNLPSKISSEDALRGKEST